MVFKRKVLYTGESPYGRYKVVDAKYNGRAARVLYGNRNTPQSGAALDGEPDLLFDYNQRFLEMIMSCQPKKLLVIGGGAFMLPIAAFHRFPEMSIDVVEIDPLLVTLSRDFFDLPDDPRMSVHVGDGANFVAQTKERYDMIILDAFSGFTIPHHLIENEAITQYKHRLTKDGVIAMNFISEYKPNRGRLAHELISSFGAVFSQLSLYQATPDYLRDEEQNLLLVAGNRPFHFEYLQASELDLYL